MDSLVNEFLRFLPPVLRGLPWRAHPLDGSLLLFERSSGLNMLLEGDETAHLQRLAPRTLLIAVTNACNMTCPFCYRDLESRSGWRYDTLLDFCREADVWGVLEVAFGGGEPMLFPQWQEFITELHDTTQLCINFTTNGTLLTAEFLHAIKGRYGQIRLSIYEDNYWAETVKLLADQQVRFGVNWLITPAELPTLEAKFGSLLQRGVRDFLLLSYKGTERDMHLNREQYQRLAHFLNRTHAALGSSVALKLDVCWGDTLNTVPRLFQSSDCGAGDEFMSITSDKLIKPCSFFGTHSGIPFDTLADVRSYWQQRRADRIAAQIGGCARLPERGLSGEIIPLAAI
jgi:MoaA/NifB/PqqE/SkfB family radical SAM enzyme